MALVFGGAVFTDASDETPGTGDAKPAPPSLVLASTLPVITDAKAPLQLDSLVRNPTHDDLAGGEIVVELSDAPVEHLAQLTDATGLTFRPLTRAEVGETPAADDTQAGELRTGIEVAASELPLTEATPAGTYLVRASLVAEGGDEPVATAIAPLVWRATDTKTGEAKPDDSKPYDTKPSGTKVDAPKPSDAKTVALSVIVPFVLPGNIHTMPTRGQLSDLTPAWDELLTAAESARATLAIDPRIIAAIRGYGEEAPADSRALLLRLEESSSPSFLLQFADADLAAQAALGFTSILEPTNLEFVTRFGEFLPPSPAANAHTDAAGAAASSGSGSTADAPGEGEQGEGEQSAGEQSGTTGAKEDASNDAKVANEAAKQSKQSKEDEDAAGTNPAPPTLAELIEWPKEPVAWPAEGNVDARTLDFLDTANVHSVVLDSGNVKHSGGPRATFSGQDVVVTDAALAAAARAALGGQTEVDQAAGRAQIAAQLAVRAQSGGAGVVLGLDRASVAAAADPASILAAISELPFVRATRVPDQPEGTASLRAAGALEPRLALLRAAADREASVNEVGAVLEDPQYLSGYQRARLLDLFATRYAPADAGFDAAATKFRTRDSELLEGVQVIRTEHTQLVGATTNVPVQLHNSLPFDASVTVTAVPVSAAVEVAQRVFAGVRVEAEGNERVLVPVHSRVTSGTSGLVVTVSAVGGEPTVFTGTLELSISTTVETVALWVLGASAVLLLAFGVVRSVRKRRKRLAPVAGAESEPGAGTVPSAAE